MHEPAQKPPSKIYPVSRALCVGEIHSRMKGLEQIRKEFYDFVNDRDIYNKFVRHLNCSGQGRLLYKQELRWNEFRTKHLDRDYTYEELQEIFRVCEIHNVALVKDTVKVQQGHLDYSRDFEEASVNLFPYARTSPIFVWDPKGRKYLDVWFCERCREAKKNYNEKMLKQIEQRNT